MRFLLHTIMLYWTSPFPYLWLMLPAYPFGLALYYRNYILWIMFLGTFQHEGITTFPQIKRTSMELWRPTRCLELAFLYEDPCYTIPLVIQVWHVVTENCVWRKILKCCVWHLILKHCTWRVISKHCVWHQPDARQTQCFKIMASNARFQNIACDARQTLLSVTMHQTCSTSPAMYISQVLFWV